MQMSAHRRFVFAEKEVKLRMDSVGLSKFLGKEGDCDEELGVKGFITVCRDSESTALIVHLEEKVARLEIHCNGFRGWLDGLNDWMMLGRNLRYFLCCAVAEGEKREDVCGGLWLSVA